MKPAETKKISVLVVDDSAFMRKSLSIMLESDPDIKVIATATNGEEALEKVLSLKPDLVTMDIEMPRMDGLTALRKIMEKRPTPVMMVSSVTTEGAEATLDALELGAVDFIPKRLSYVSLDIVKLKDELLMKIKDIVNRKHLLMTAFRRRQRLANAAQMAHMPHVASSTISARPALGALGNTHPIRVIGIGSSTGGPPALQAIISKLPRQLPVGVVIAQHMPAMFTKSLAERLNSISEVTVTEAVNHEEIKPGCVYLSPGGKHIKVANIDNKNRIVITSNPITSLYKPSVDILMNSIAELYHKSALGIILTGMGSDGLKGMSALKQEGGIIIAQNEATCVVYGMPRAVVEANITDQILPVDEIPYAISRYF